MKRVTLELQLSFQFVVSVKVKAYFLEAPMNVSGVAQGQMEGSFIMKKSYPLYLFFSQGISGVAQRQIGAVSSGKSYIHCIYLSLTAMGKLGGSWWFSGALGGSRGQPRDKWGAVLSGKSYVHGIYFSLNTGGINGALD